MSYHCLNLVFHLCLNVIDLSNVEVLPPDQNNEELGGDLNEYHHVNSVKHKYKRIRCEC